MGSQRLTWMQLSVLKAVFAAKTTNSPTRITVDKMSPELVSETIGSLVSMQFVTAVRAESGEWQATGVTPAGRDWLASYGLKHPPRHT